MRMRVRTGTLAGATNGVRALPREAEPPQARKRLRAPGEPPWARRAPPRKTSGVASTFSAVASVHARAHLIARLAGA